MIDNQQDSARLPKNVVPAHYFLTIVPDLNTFEFSGDVTINVCVREKTNTVVLNALDIKIQSASFVSNNRGKFYYFYLNFVCFHF